MISPPKCSPTLIVHGGAWNIPDDMVEDHLRGVRAAIATGWSVLKRGGSSLDAIEESVVVMEEDEVFDAGRGSFLTSDGHVQLDALMMDGATLRAGGVGCVERIRNPIRAARKVLDESPHVYLVAGGAELFAEAHVPEDRVLIAAGRQAVVEDVAELVSQNHPMPPHEVELEARDVIIRVAAPSDPGRGPRRARTESGSPG